MMAASILGRPTKYDPKYCQEAIDFIGDLGKSVTQFARHIRVSKSTVYLWAENHSEFSDALSMAQDWSQAVWEDKLEDFMTDKSVNAPLVKLYFANRFRWHDSAPDQDTEAPAIDPVFNVADPKSDIKVTNAKP